MLKELEKALNSPSFFAKKEKFLRKHELEFQSDKEAQEFMRMHLISVCISGVNYSRPQLKKVRRKVNYLMRSSLVICADDLPMLEGSSNTDNVWLYIVSTNTCLIQEKPAS